MLPSSTSNFQVYRGGTPQTTTTDTYEMASFSQTPTGVANQATDNLNMQQANLWQQQQQMLAATMFNGSVPAIAMVANGHSNPSNQAQHTAAPSPSSSSTMPFQMPTGAGISSNSSKKQKLASVPADQISINTGISLGGGSNANSNSTATSTLGMPGSNCLIPAGSGNIPVTTDKATTQRRASSSYSAASSAAIHAHDKLRHEEVIHAMRLHQPVADMLMFRPDETNRESTDASKVKDVDIAIVPPLQGMANAKSSRMSQGPTLPMAGAAGKESASIGKHGLSLSSDNTQRQPHKYRRVVGGKAPVPDSNKPEDVVSPQIFLDKLLQSRGYSTKTFCSLEGGYYCKPTPLQKASYGTKVVHAVRTSDNNLLRRFLQCGLSRNPCNAFGESLLHMVCRRGNHTMLKTLADHGCDLQVSDDFGRTPLHDACWTAEPNFECVELILNVDVRLLHIADCRGACPLSYVKRDNWGSWIDFFERKKEQFWPARDVKKDGEEPPPKLCQEAAHSKPVPDPESAADLKVATMIASGQANLENVLLQKDGDKKLKAGISPSSSKTIADKAKDSNGLGHTSRSIMSNNTAVAISSHITSPA